MDTINIVNEKPNGLSGSSRSSPSLEKPDPVIPIEDQAATEDEQKARLSSSNGSLITDSDDQALEKRFGMKNEFVRSV
jgi:hypothetical protein